jgi:hypothetical protein
MKLKTSQSTLQRVQKKTDYGRVESIVMRILKLSAHISSQIRQSTTSSRQGFGSFHCEDIETLIRQKDDEYQRPQVYDEVLYQSTKRNAEIIDDFEFGSHAKRDLFALGRRSLNCMINRSSSASAFSSDDIGIIFCIGI